MPRGGSLRPASFGDQTSAPIGIADWEAAMFLTLDLNLNLT
jgi:hypothetical protein